MHAGPRSKRWRQGRGEMHSRAPKSHVHANEDVMPDRRRKAPHRTQRIVSNFEFVENDFSAAHEDPRHSQVSDAAFGTARRHNRHPGNSWGLDEHLDCDEQGDTQRRPRHPPHLRGREIGLFYARRSKQTRNRQDKERPEILVSATCNVKYASFEL